MNTWITADIIKIQKWENNLFSLFLKAPINPFIAGQFTKISYKQKNFKSIQRAYSFVNAPNEKYLELYIVLIKNGLLTPKLYNLTNLDKIKIAKQSSGYFTLNEILPCETLWMFATGTGIGPYLSILKNKKGTEKFKNIVLIHAVKYAKDLTYLNTIQNLAKQYQGKLYVQFITSREHTNFSLMGRIPQLLQNNKIEKNINLYIDKNTSHIMLCGNPQMVTQTKKLLIETKNMKKNLRRNPGHITSENYW